MLTILQDVGIRADRWQQWCPRLRRPEITGGFPPKCEELDGNLKRNRFWTWETPTFHQKLEFDMPSSDSGRAFPKASERTICNELGTIPNKNCMAIHHEIHCYEFCYWNLKSPKIIDQQEGRNRGGPISFRIIEAVHPPLEAWHLPLGTNNDLTSEMLWAPIFLRTGWLQCRPQPLHEVTRRIAIILLLLSYAKPPGHVAIRAATCRVNHRMLVLSSNRAVLKLCILKSSWPPAQALKSSVMLQEFHRFRALPLRIKDANPWGTEDLQITATCSLCGVVNPGVGRLSPSWCWRSGALYKQRFGFRPQCLGPWECFLSRPKNIKWEFAGISKM